MKRRGARLGSGTEAAPQDAPSAKYLGQIVDSAAGAGGVLALRRRTRYEGLERLVPLKFAARLREQMHAGSKSAGHQNGIARNAAPGLHDAAVHSAQADGADLQIALGAEHGRARQYFHASAPRGVGEGTRNLRAQVGDRSNDHACGVQIERRLIGVVACRSR